MKFCFLFLALLIFSKKALLAQTSQNDFIVYANGDTAFGRVISKGSSNEMFFSSGNVTTRHTPTSIRSYYANGLEYKSIVAKIYASTHSISQPYSMNYAANENSKPEFEMDTSFVLVIVSGRLSLYKLSHERLGNHFLVQKGDSIFDLFNHKYVTELPNQSADNLNNKYLFQSHDYAAVLSRLTVDCASVQPMINTDMMTNARLTDFVAAYNQCKDSVETRKVLTGSKMDKRFRSVTRFGVGAGIAFTDWDTNYPKYNLDQAEYEIKPVPFAALQFDVHVGSLRQRLRWQNRVGLLHYRVRSEDTYKNWITPLHGKRDFDIYNLMAASGAAFGLDVQGFEPFAGLGISLAYPLVKKISIVESDEYGWTGTREFFNKEKPVESGGYLTAGVVKGPFIFQWTYSSSCGGTFVPTLAFYGTKRRSHILTLGYAFVMR